MYHIEVWVELQLHIPLSAEIENLGTASMTSWVGGMCFAGTWSHIRSMSRTFSPYSTIDMILPLLTLDFILQDVITTINFSND